VHGRVKHKLTPLLKPVLKAMVPTLETTYGGGFVSSLVTLTFATPLRVVL
jgi:hypothetical protein